MSAVTSKWNYRTPILIFLIAVLSSSCGQKDIYEGVYEARAVEPAECRLELMEKGQAVWRVQANEVSFRWQVKGRELWLSSKSGGIIIGRTYGETIEIRLPGADTMVFKKVE